MVGRRGSPLRDDANISLAVLAQRVAQVRRDASPFSPPPRPSY